jgi:hypothetical protein
MCGLAPLKPSPEVPGLAYFVAQPVKPRRTEPRSARPEMTVLEQMYGYFCA